MKDKKTSFPMSLEPERYEFAESAAYHFDVDRRQFLKVFGGGIVIFVKLDEALQAQEAGGKSLRGFGDPLPNDLAAWLHVGGDGVITVYTGKVEVGQNVRTSLAQAVADELHLPMESVQLIMGDTDRTPYDIGTFGSFTTPQMAPHLRKASATAREILTDLAAKQWNVDRATLVVASGKVSDPAKNRSIAFGELTKGEKLIQTISDPAPTTAAGNWTVAGRSAAKVNGRAFVTGRHRFASDIKLPDMLYGKVLRPPSFEATLVSVDTSEAEAMERVVVVKDGDFVGVAAPSQHQAARAVDAIRAEWASTSHPLSKDLFDYLKANPSDTRGWRGPRRYAEGSSAKGLATADRKLEARYTVAYIAHASLEPRAAVAQWKGGKLTVWTGTQRPFKVRDQLTEAFHLPENQVRVIVPDTGSGYGGKHTGECAIEAARLAKAAGRPVKLVWTREEEFTWAYFRPAGLIEVTSGVKNDGTLTAWEFHNYNSGHSAIEGRYEIPNLHIEFHPARSPLRQGSYRALAATANHFARESHLDELAHAIGMDPLEFRLKNLKDERLIAVLEAAAKQFEWGKRKASKDRGLGLAGGFEAGSYVATFAEVSIGRPSEKVCIDRLVTAFECGAIVNPDSLKNQVEGAVIMGIGGALFEAIDFAEGKIENPFFSQYRVPRFSDLPALETILLDRNDLPSAGAGETPIVCVAPAIANAIWSATGTRLRSLPMIPDGLKGV